MDRCYTLEILLINYVVNFVSDFFVVPFAVSTACDVTRSLHHQIIMPRHFFATRSNYPCEDKEVTESSQMPNGTSCKKINSANMFPYCYFIFLPELFLLFHLSNFPLLRKYTSTVFLGRRKCEVCVK